MKNICPFYIVPISSFEGTGKWGDFGLPGDFRQTVVY